MCVLVFDLIQGRTSDAISRCSPPPSCMPPLLRFSPSFPFSLQDGASILGHCRRHRAKRMQWRWLDPRSCRRDASRRDKVCERKERPRPRG
eukprot:818789-Rhodomonas_salina.1